MCGVLSLLACQAAFATLRSSSTSPSVAQKLPFSAFPGVSGSGLFCSTIFSTSAFGSMSYSVLPSALAYTLLSVLSSVTFSGLLLRVSQGVEQWLTHRSAQCVVKCLCVKRLLPWQLVGLPLYCFSQRVDQCLCVYIAGSVFFSAFASMSPRVKHSFNLNIA